MNIKDLTTKDIAKLIRSDLKNQFGKTVKFSVRTHYFSMGSEINIYIKSASSSLFKEDGNKIQNLNDEVLEKIKAVVDKYQTVESDPYHDYYNTNFYNHISDWNEKIGKFYIERI